jgi:hypothetical protein
MKLNMNISGLNHIRPPFKTITQQSNMAPLPKQGSSNLNAPMVTRIFNVKPGCGSCGK